MIAIKKAEFKKHAPLIIDCQLEMAMESEGLELDREKAKKGVHGVFEDPSRGQYYVAEIEGDFVGCLLTTYEWSDWRGSTCLWIQSVYVTQKSRRKGVYTALYDHLKALVEDSDAYCGIRLYVEKDNEAAKITYSKLGMTPEHYDLYEWLK